MLSGRIRYVHSPLEFSLRRAVQLYVEIITVQHNNRDHTAERYSFIKVARSYSAPKLFTVTRSSARVFTSAGT